LLSVWASLVPRPLPEGDAASDTWADGVLLAQVRPGRQIGADALAFGALAPATAKGSRASGSLVGICAGAGGTSTSKVNIQPFRARHSPSSVSR